MMKKTLYLLALLVPVLVLGQTQTENYVKTTVYRDTLSTNPMSSIGYFDGLGRSVQQIAGKQSDTGKDIVTHIAYDSLGRQRREYLPYASTQNNLAFISPSTLPAAITAQYQAIYGDTVAYSEKLFEHSPLGRVLMQSAPGNDWRMGQGHEVKFGYTTNIINEVRRFRATTAWDSLAKVYEPSLMSDGYYNEKMLYKTVTKNENWTSGKANTTEEFKDKAGRVLLKRTYTINGSPISVQTTYDTYYVYDDYGNLTFVLPPLVNTGSTITQTILDNLCYQYKYDHRNRLVEKKLPGRQREAIIYNNQDMPVAAGPVLNPFDGSSQGWLITKYDVFGRVAYTGWFGELASVENRADYQELADGVVWPEHFVNSASTIDGFSVNYSNTVYPTNITLLTVNYYDDYAFSGMEAVTPAIEAPTFLKYPKGLATGNWVRVLEDDSQHRGNTGITFYDKKARPVLSHTRNYLGGFTQVDTALDFSGKAQYTILKHKRTTTDSLITVTDRFRYTLQDRIKAHNHQVNDLSEQNLAYNIYDELGQLMQKNVGKDTLSALQYVNFKYNIRGWLKQINVPDSLTVGSDEPDLFAYKVNYNRVEKALGVTVVPLYNGNISETFWQTSTDNVLRQYGYTYDTLNRLTKAEYQKVNAGVPLATHMYDESVTYDKNGNIQELHRNGDFDADYAVVGPFEIDDLEYIYDTYNKNLLREVTDGSISPKGFNDVNAGKDYEYDDFGNLISDKNKDIGTIVYNHLNLPVEINFGTGSKIEYLYDATGRKLSKKVDYGDGIVTTDYLDGFQYVDEKMVFFPHAEGYVNVTFCGECTKPEYLFNYVYQYKDHLGNVRVNYGLDPSDGNLKILDENHYYPFGLKHTKYNMGEKYYEPTEDPEVLSIEDLPPGASQMNKYKYNGKEWQDELSLNMYDYGARNYDPALGRWMNIDPLAEVSRRYSPYVYALNNPVYFIDPDGMMAVKTEAGQNVLAEELQEAEEPEDWFVNNQTGGVVFVRGESTLTQEQSDAIGAGDAKNYDRLGPDEMFGNKVPYGYDSNLLDNKAYNVENPERFMDQQGYAKAENVTIKESEFMSGGAWGEEKITQIDTSLEQLGESKITYARTRDLNSKENIKEVSSSDTWSSISRYQYDLTKPYGQDNHVTANFYRNRSSNANIGKAASLVDNLMKIVNAAVIAIQKL